MPAGTALCRDEASFVTGQVIAVDGGSSLMNPDFPLACKGVQIEAETHLYSPRFSRAYVIDRPTSSNSSFSRSS
jgi:hypothetical protein